MLSGVKCVERNGKKICVDKDTGERWVDGPGMVRRAMNFTKAATRHAAKGRPRSTEQEIKKRYEICSSCPDGLFRLLDAESVPNRLSGVEGVGTCIHKSCGCNIHPERKFPNKLAWADQSCPRGHWSANEKKPGGVVVDDT